MIFRQQFKGKILSVILDEKTAFFLLKCKISRRLEQQKFVKIKSTIHK